MAEKITPISVRLPADLGRRFQALRLLVAVQLERPIEEQVSIVLSQIQKTKPSRQSSPTEVEP